MPLYDYICTECNTSEEHLVGPERPAKLQCPHCEGQAIRQIGLSQLRFIGPGFQTPRPPMDNPWEGAVENADEFLQKSRDYQDKRRDRGYIPDRDTRIVVDQGG